MPIRQEIRKLFIKKHALFLQKVLKKSAKEFRINNDIIEIKTTLNNLRAVLYFLKKNTLSQYENLTEIACSDNPGKKRRFSMTYILYSLQYNAYIHVLVQTNEVQPVPSITPIFSGSGWMEREIWDLFGVFFEEHPDLRRILTDYGFSGHPLRKDFPLSGFFEVYYNDSTKRLSYEPVELAQEYRSYAVKSPWIQELQKKLTFGRK